jgi:C4-dicarboxylate-specific signal transduction histidine kinase
LPNNQALRMTGTYTDISERKQIEKEKAQLQSQLAQAQKMESVGRLAGGVAHDFNNMLGVILGHTELAQDQVAKTEPLFEDLEEIKFAAQRSADLTRQLLAFARKQTVSPKVLDLNQTVALSMCTVNLGTEQPLRYISRNMSRKNETKRRWMGQIACRKDMRPS